MTMLVADSSFVVALLNLRDAAHDRCAAVARSQTMRAHLPSPALTELCWVLDRTLGQASVAKLVELLASPSAGIDLLDPTLADYLRAGEVLRKYGDSGLDFVDAVIVAVAERLEARTILTLDTRHFGLVRPRHCPAFELLPAE